MMIGKCSNCAHELAADAAFCPSCGQPTERPDPSKRRSVPWLAAGLGVVGVSALGLVGFRLLSATSAEFVGGAGSPEGAVEAFVAAVASEDVFGAVSFIAPDEIDGAADVLEALLSTLDAGSGGLADGTDFAVELELTDVDATMEGDNAAIVSFELSGSVGAGDNGGPASVALPSSVSFRADDLEDLYPRSGAEVEVVTVRLGGNWYVSPMLSFGHLIVENGDLPSGDLDLVGDERAGGANDPEAAVEAMVAAIEDRDVDDFAESLGGGEGRFAAVYSDAIDELLGEIPPDVQYTVDARTDAAGGDRVVLEDVEVTWSDAFSFGTVEVEDDCVSFENEFGERDRTCVLDELPLNSSIDETIELVTVEEDDGWRVRLVPTVTDLASRFVPAVDRQTFLYVAWLEWADAAIQTSVGSDVAFDFDGDLYRVFEFPVQGGQRHRVSAEGSFEVFVRTEDQTWNRERASFTPESDTSARVVVYSENDDDDEWYGFPDGEGGDVLRVRAVPTQTGQFPAILAGELGPGDEILFDLEVAASEIVQVDFAETGGSLVWQFVGGDHVWFGGDVYEVQRGGVQISVRNDGTDSGSFELTPGPVSSGFDGSRRTVIDISGNGGSARVLLPGGVSTITANPLDGQDIVLEIPSLGCFADEGLDGDSERCRVSSDGSSEVWVEASGWGSSDSFGRVELVLS